MVFSSLIFLCVFTAVFFITYYFVPNRFGKNLVLFIFSLLFYAWGEPIYIFLMLVSIFANYIIAIKMGRYKEICSNKKSSNYRYAEIKYARKMSKVYLIFAIVFNILLLVIFKYTDFLIGIINGIFRLQIADANIALPIGISFYTFQILSYVVDVYRGNVEVQTNFINLGAYVAAFPQLIAGPIVRYKDIEKGLTDRKESMKLTTSGMRYFIVGLSKKAILANFCGEMIKIIVSYSNVQYKFVGAFIIAICYTLQIYFDFSGYSDMAIGLGKMIGFNYNINFNYPYIASSVTDFWRRWHISLSSFFRDYVYIPLGGNRVGVKKHILNLLIVWLLTGLWHGASWNFVLWGLYYGVILIIEKYIPEKFKNKIPKVVGHILTLIAVIFGWIIFRIENMEEFCEFMKTLFGAYGFGNYEFFRNIGLLAPHYIFVLVCAIIGSTPLVKNIYDKFSENKYAYVAFDVILIVLLLLSFALIAVGSYNPFIYFKF